MDTGAINKGKGKGKHKGEGKGKKGKGKKSDRYLGEMLRSEFFEIWLQVCLRIR